MTLLRHRCHLDNAVAKVRALGMPPGELLTRSGLVDEVLVGARGYLPLLPVLEFEERCAAALEEPTFGLRLGLGTDPQEVGLLGYLASCSATPREALESLARFFPLHQNCSGIRISEEGDTTRLIYELETPCLHDYPQDIDFAMGFGASMLRFLVDDSVTFEIALPYQRLPHHAAYEALCGSPLRFDPRDPALVVPTPVLDAPSRRPDTPLFHILTDFARLKVARAEPDELIARIRSSIGKSLQRDNVLPTLDQVSRRLCLGSRTLQRQLKLRGTTFRRLVDSTRHRLAIEYLRSREASLSQVATALAFSELSAFDRAFRRWTGRSPGDFRRHSFGVD